MVEPQIRKEIVTKKCESKIYNRKKKLIRQILQDVGGFLKNLYLPQQYSFILDDKKTQLLIRFIIISCSFFSKTFHNLKTY